VASRALLADSDMGACLGTRTQPVVLWLEARRMAALAGVSAKGTKVCEGVRGPEPLWSQHHPMLAAVELRQPGRGQATPSAPGRAFARPDLYSKGAVSPFVRRCSRLSPLSRWAQVLSLCLPRSILTLVSSQKLGGKVAGWPEFV